MLRFAHQHFFNSVTDTKQNETSGLNQRKKYIQEVNNLHKVEIFVLHDN